MDGSLPVITTFLLLSLIGYVMSVGGRTPEQPATAEIQELADKVIKFDNITWERIADLPPSR